MEQLLEVFQGLRAANLGEILGLSSSAFIFLVSILNFLTKTKTKKIELKDQAKEVETVQKLSPSKKTEIPWAQRLSAGLKLSREQVWGKIANLVSGGGISSEMEEEIEELLYSSDMAPQTVEEILEEIKKAAKKEGDFDFKKHLRNFLAQKLHRVQAKLDPSSWEEKTQQKTKVIMIVGVNGAGKTTTIGKLATRLKRGGAKVVVGACDTFRAAAVEQLQVWCERAGVEMVRAKEGADPSGVGYEALQKAINSQADYCLLDTAGRLHTKTNLMEELRKSKRVLSKLDPSAPHEVILVIDSITGQNALRQAEEFNKALELTGLVFTKCDGSSKAGNAISIVEKLQVPIVYIGVGEGVDDLNLFNTEHYLDALIGV